jgi:uncharacterized protein
MIKLPINFKLIISFIAGSHLYGTSTKDSDEDLRGVFIPSEEYFYGFLHRVEQFEDKINDITFFDIRKFLSLAINNNPNIVEFLYVPRNKWIVSSNEWERIIDNKTLFLSTKCKHTFLGYAHSQLNRIKRHRGWLLNPPKEKPTREKYGLLNHKSFLSKDQIGAFNMLLSLYLKQIGKSHKLRNQLEEMEETVTYISLTQNLTEIDYDSVKKIIPISDNMVEALDREKKYINAINQWQSYQSWKKNRNPDRAILEEKYGFDTKHGSHLFRLITEGEELLTSGYITFPRPDADLLLDIRNGKWTYDQLIEKVENFESKFEYLYENSALPKKPNRKEIDKICVSMVKEYLHI